jgi:hypothetical protein
LFSFEEFDKSNSSFTIEDLFMADMNPYSAEQRRMTDTAACITTLFSSIPLNTSFLHSISPHPSSDPHPRLKISFIRYALASRLLHPHRHWRQTSHSRVQRSDPLYEITLLHSLMAHERIQLWPPLASWLVSTTAEVQDLNREECKVMIFRGTRLIMGRLKKIAEN